MKRLRRLGIVGIILFISLVVMSLPVFRIETVIVSGNVELSKEEIVQTAEADTGTNIFAYISSKYEKKLMSVPIIKTANIQKIYPNKLSISVVERMPIGYIVYLENTYIAIDNEGVVLDVSNSYNKQLPFIVGLKFNEFNLGQKLQVEDEQVFDDIVTLADAFSKYDLISRDIKIDVSNLDDIHVYCNEMDVKFGDVRNSDEKVRKIKAIIEQYPDKVNTKGQLDISNPSDKIIFKIIT